MVGGVVALLTEVRRTFLEQPGLRGPVGCMTQGAVLADRRVLEEVRTALVSVTFVAGVVDAGAHQVLVLGAAVRIVAVGANDLALDDRVMRPAIRLRTLLRVAGE